MRSVEALCEQATLLVRSDLKAAAGLAREALAMSAEGGVARERGMALRCEGIVLWAETHYLPALERFEQALEWFEVAGDEVEVARTRSNAIQTLIYLSRYEQALEWAALARVVFEAHGEEVRLARLDGNIANLLYRQDRFEEAIALYEDVERRFARVGQVQDVAAVLRNKAVCQLSLSRFEDALHTHERSRSLCVARGMKNLVAEADYNIAYLHFLRGDYLDAKKLYETARVGAQEAGDRYHEALCDLDQAEMYLELNLWEEGEAMAQRARLALRRLGMGYEAAKAEVFVGLCVGRQGDLKRALQLLGRARRSFERENNAVWPALIDLYGALLLDRSGAMVAARVRGLRALGFFSQTVLPAKAVQCRLLLARLELGRGRTASARGHVLAAERLLPYAQSPVLAGHTWNVAGRLAEAGGDRHVAAEMYARAEGEFEALRDRLGSEDLRISFFQDKTEAYESHFLLLAEEGRTNEAFVTAERAKSRVLVGMTAPRPSLGMVGEAAQLNALRHQLEEAELGRGTCGGREQIQARIAGLTQRVETTRHGGHQPAPVMEDVAAVLAEGTRLVEYFRAGEFYYVFVVGGGVAKMARLGRVERVVELMRFVQFQMGRASRMPGQGGMKQAAADCLTGHLRGLYEELVGPVEGLLDGEHCVVVPHGLLHWVPFHALHDGNGYLGERLTVSVAPSAALYLKALEERAEVGQGSAVFGVADGAAPQIREEALMVAGLSAGARLFFDQEATVERLRAEGGRVAHLHIATHGQFRRDNPWFSSLRMGDGALSLYDLHEMKMPAELVVLSGCSTGLSVVMGGDEPVGLVRGLLHAGARAALLSLWNVSDASTTRFMREFYAEVFAGQELARALQVAQQRTREEYPHPFHWAAFSLVGWHGRVSVKKE